jgi:hypothetical protein
MSEVKGSFIIRNEGNGCLTSIYLEHRTNTPYTECCKQITTDNPNDPFAGHYNTCWLEEGWTGARTANLSIQQSEGNRNIYNLRWTNIPESEWRYQGTAMLFEGKLAGCYWKE